MAGGYAEIIAEEQLRLWAALSMEETLALHDGLGRNASTSKAGSGVRDRLLRWLSGRLRDAGIEES